MEVCLVTSAQASRLGLGSQAPAPGGGPGSPQAARRRDSCLPCRAWPVYNFLASPALTALYAALLAFSAVPLTFDPRRSAERWKGPAEGGAPPSGGLPVRKDLTFLNGWKSPKKTVSFHMKIL